MFELMRSVQGSTQQEYRQLLRRYFRLYVRKVSMERTLTDQELDESKQYTQVTTQTEVLNTQLDDLLGEFDSEDFHAVFKSLDE